MIKILKKRILRNRGFSYVVLSVLIIIVMLVGVAIFEIIRINIQAAAVRDKFEDAIISMCVDNYAKMYQPIREGNAASYGYNGSRWLQQNNATERYIRAYLAEAMSSGEIMQCDITAMTFDVTSADLAPTDVDTAQKYSINGTLTIRIPYRFAWDDLAPISMQLSVKSQWRAKF